MKLKIKSFISNILFFSVIFFVITTFQQRNLLSNDQPAPYFNLKTLQTGERVSIKSLQNQQTVVYFFAPWCTVCKLSMPNLDRLAKNGSINAIAIAADYESKQQVQAFVDDLSLSMPVLLADSHTASNYKISAFPTYYVISEDLKIIAKSMGYSTELGLRARSF